MFCGICRQNELAMVSAPNIYIYIYLLYNIYIIVSWWYGSKLTNYGRPLFSLEFPHHGVPFAATCGHSSGCKWLQVAASGCKCSFSIQDAPWLCAECNVICAKTRCKLICLYLTYIPREQFCRCP